MYCKNYKLIEGCNTILCKRLFHPLDQKRTYKCIFNTCNFSLLFHMNEEKNKSKWSKLYQLFWLKSHCPYSHFTIQTFEKLQCKWKDLFFAFTFLGVENSLKKICKSCYKGQSNLVKSKKLLLSWKCLNIKCNSYDDTHAWKLI